MRQPSFSMHSQTIHNSAFSHYQELLYNSHLSKIAKQAHQPDQLQRALGNNDLQGFKLTLSGQHRHSSEQDQNQNSNDQDLILRIHEYNKVAKTLKKQQERENRRRKNREQEGKPKRKVRTTITPDKLEEMNRIFRNFEEQKEKVKEEFSNEENNSNLKSIGEQLGLGYSTILHKYREYRATKKVKGGALLASLNQKRKYKKSRQIEDLIEKSLANGKFYTAVDLSRHIEKQFGRTLSRSIISRHLGEMGYSYKNTKAKLNKDCPQLKEMRKKFATAIAYLRKVEKCSIYYIDEFIFSQDSQEQQFFGNTNLTILASTQGIQDYVVKDHLMYQEEFFYFLKKFVDSLDGNPQKAQIIVLDMENHLHFSEEVITLRKGVMKEKNIRLFYLPPNSNQLNLLEWVIPILKQHLGNRELDSPEYQRQGLQEGLRSMKEQNFEHCLQNIEEYELKCLKLQSFD